MCKLAGCVKVNRKFHYKTGYRNQQLVTLITAGLKSEVLMMGDS
jgi:hypothetical protein